MSPTVSITYRYGYKVSSLPVLEQTIRWNRDLRSQKVAIRLVAHIQNLSLPLRCRSTLAGDKLNGISDTILPFKALLFLVPNKGRSICLDLGDLPTL